MIGNKLQENKNMKPNSLEMEKLKEVLPQYFNNKGEFEIDKFKDFLKLEEIDLSKEGYGLEFLGQSYAKYLSSLETETYLSPDIEHNSKEENRNSENLYIVGDNIDALKHLLNSYAGRIKCIYIDPPYNTGSDGFVYPDNFQFNSEELSNRIGITEEEAKRILDLAGKSTHSAWLTFMYPRLLLARDLLSKNGVIFISIDDNEQGNLRLICDEIFGEENFEGHVHWRRRSNQPNDRSKMIGLVAEHILIYAKNSLFLKEYGVGKIGLTGNFSNPDNDPRGLWNSKPWKVGSDQSGSRYKITTPDGRVLDEEWMGDEQSYLKLIEDNRIYFPKEGRGWPRKKIFKEERELEGQCANNWWNHTEFGSNQKGSARLTDLFEGNQNLFSKPKPTELIERILNVTTTDDDFYILDFFSGSATTADAVMQLNAEDQGKRKYLMVQLPESIEKNKPAYKLGYKTLDEVGRARIEKAANKIKIETNADIDYGYKLYYLETPEEKTLIELENFEPELKLITDDMISVFDNNHSSGKESILATWINEDGYGLTKCSIPYKLEHYSADFIDKSLYIIDEGLEDEDVMTLIKRIENEELEINRVVVYVHSIRFNVLQELRKNLKVLRNNKNVTLIERF
ncbi:site-specific DNA-methyltransferase [Staphylococcus lutrae]|uniref:Restriction endonuclease subunit M n=1 Tax=Staphylococcus lutrae TaxID=155085 RepID=A0AAC9RV72_9STAP|nr:site-specific DNA-methyltransferase [Staphylococcus lutrae]ARJ50362.1 restriction endonuclease subunit M [Staphylococcus lutrae]PNZ34895.1 site-specific DNA-methyltransferase [Staphylococcus lutrae]